VHTSAFPLERSAALLVPLVCKTLHTSVLSHSAGWTDMNVSCPAWDWNEELTWHRRILCGYTYSSPAKLMMRAAPALLEGYTNM